MSSGTNDKNDTQSDEDVRPKKLRKYKKPILQRINSSESGGKNSIATVEGFRPALSPEGFVYQFEFGMS